SFYNERCSTGRNVLPFDEFFHRFPRGGRYAARLTNWANAFGWDRIRVRTLDPSDLVNGALIDDFEAAIGASGLERPGLRRVSRPWYANEIARWAVARAGV